MNIAVIGAGSYGTALALVAARARHQVRLWARRPEVAAALAEGRVSDYYLSGASLPDTVAPTASLREALDGAEIVITAVPSHGTRAIFRSMLPYLSQRQVFVSATKGIENDSLMRMSEVVWYELRDCFDPRFVVLSGPSFAAEVASGQPTAVVAASYTEEWRNLVQRELSSGSFRVYTNSDVVGVELGGSLKNVMAIATGVVAGLGFGQNSIAAIITRGLAEMTRLAVAAGGRVETLAGLAGLGDLVLTCNGELSRNRRVGVELGRGRSLKDILGETREVAEGVKTTQAARALGRKLGVELPITEAAYTLLYEERDPRAVAEQLMGRPLKKE